jgi:hypothetical protein
VHPDHDEVDAVNAALVSAYQHSGPEPPPVAANSAVNSQGTTFTPIEHALITAAIDARCLGHTHCIPEPLLTAAALPTHRPSWCASCCRPLQYRPISFSL